MAVALACCYTFYMCFFAVGVCWLWPEFVEDSPYANVRRLLFWMFAVQAALEVCMFLGGAMGLKLLALAAFVNVWGMLDAFLRFPIAHDVDTLFGLKQFVLFMVKLIGYIFGLWTDMDAPWLVFVVWLNVITLPLLWLMAVPVEIEEKHDSVDLDIAVRLYRLLSKPKEREHIKTIWKRARRRCVVDAVTAAPALRPLALKWDPSLATVLRKSTAV